jgi:LacI family transcriptional regulator
MVTSRDVARGAGVSQATVSRVLQNSTHVRPETRARVLTALKEVGYTPNAHARAMRTGRTSTIGIVMGRVTNPFYPELLGALGQALSDASQRMILWLSEGPAELGAVEAIHGHTIDGVIFTTVREGSVALEEAIAAKAPFVLVNRVIEGLRCDQVASDNFEGARAVARYFAQHGHDSVGVVCGVPGISTNDERLSGFIAGLKDEGQTIKSRNIVTGDFTHAHGMRALAKLMALKVPPTAIFCVNDLLAFGVLSGAGLHGLNVPADLWVVGYDDIAMSSWHCHDLSTVKQRLDDMAGATVELLLARIADRDRNPTTLRFPSQLAIRGSTDNKPTG